MNTIGDKELTERERETEIAELGPAQYIAQTDASRGSESRDGVQSKPHWTRVYTSRGRKFKIRSSLIPKPRWFDSLAVGLVEVLTLPSNWDLNGGRSINLDIVNVALALAPRILGSESRPPWVVPLSDGGIQLEWHLSGAELEIEIDSTHAVTGYWFCESTEEEEEFEMGEDLDCLRSYIARIC